MTEPADIWNSLRNAIEDRDLQQLASLCEQHEETIRTHFSKWREIPPEVRLDRVQRDAYAQSLVTLAQVFERAGKPELLESLQREDPDNPVDQLDDRLEEAKKLVNDRDFENAIALLENMIVQYDDWLGPEVQESLARTQGLLGVTWAHAGDLSKAILHTRIALNLCQDLDDQEGIEIYTESLAKMEELLENG